MVKGSLVDRAVKAGRQLVELIRGKGLDPRMSVWLHDQQRDEWQLVFVLDDVRAKGIRPTLQVIQGIFKSNGARLRPIEFMDVDVVAPSEPLARELERSWKSASPSLRKQALRVGGFQIGDRYLDDGLLYPRSNIA